MKHGCGAYSDPPQPLHLTFIEDIVACLPATVVWVSLSQPLRFNFVKHQEGSIQSLNSCKFAKFSRGCTSQRPSSMTHSLRSFKSVSLLKNSGRFQSLILHTAFELKVLKPYLSHTLLWFQCFLWVTTLWMCCISIVFCTAWWPLKWQGKSYQMVSDKFATNFNINIDSWIDVFVSFQYPTNA